MGKLIIAVFLMFAVTCFAMNVTDTQEQKQAGEWVNDWWDKGYKSRIKDGLPQAKVQQCNKRLKYYTQKLKNNTDSEYYRIKLKTWLIRCGEPIIVDKSKNP